MASRRKNHVQKLIPDSSNVLERKLRPIYDCLDYGNYKKALQESEKVLKKHPASNTAKSLKALAMIRLGRIEEALPIAESVHSTKPSDESTLQVLNICYKEANKLALIADMYESAVEQCPDSEEYLSHLFMAHVRIDNYKRQQQIAVKLHKLKPDNNPYYYWSVMSLVLQASEPDAKLPAMLLALAEKMAKVSRKNLAALELNAEVTLLCLILEKQNKYAESLDVLRGEMGKNLMTDEIFKRTRIAELLILLGRLDEANAFYKQLILDRPDNWEFYTSYISTCLKMVDSEFTPSSDSIDCDSTLDSATEFLTKNSETNSLVTKPQRAPLLAMLEFNAVLLERSKGNSDGYRSRLVEYFLQYCEMFGSKQCCYKDLSKYLVLLLPSGGDEEFLGKVFRAIGLKDPSAEEAYHLTSTKDIQRHILQHQLERLSGNLNSLSESEKVSRAQLLRSHFLCFSSTVEKDVLSTDVKTCDNYIILAVHILMDVYASTGDDKYILQSLAWLEQAIKISPATHQISLLLVYIYTSIGVYGPVPQLITDMEVKQILYDSVGYLYSGQAMAHGHFSIACQHYDQMLKFFNSSNREICDCLIQCYKFGTFSKVEEFGDYKRRAANSVQYAIAVNEKQVLDMIFESKSYDALACTVTYLPSVPEKDTINWDQLRDNRDIPASDSWDREKFTDNHKLHTFNEQKHWLRYRNLSIRLIATSVHLAAGSTDTPNLLDLLDTLAKDYHEQLSVWKEMEEVEVPRFTTISTRLKQEVKAGLLDIFGSMIRLVVEVVATCSNPAPELRSHFRWHFLEALSSCKTGCPTKEKETWRTI
ncbi:N-alpha-acetyltransferase 25, NatB auxiliary subunit-like isoform X2 [Watersipora subatra]|uniref:N-alpha-acetyltransferase 25, NatB auxiliary subunit-like isoform X2 n=1 Tax=Watersipora subatra TaxID=2589382 RepID=UPI00355AEAB5